MRWPFAKSVFNGQSGPQKLVIHKWPIYDDHRTTIWRIGAGGRGPRGGEGRVWGVGDPPWEVEPSQTPICLGSTNSCHYPCCHHASSSTYMPLFLLCVRVPMPCSHQTINVDDTFYSLATYNPIPWPYLQGISSRHPCLGWALHHLGSKTK